jgi:hypothetical protein
MKEKCLSDEQILDCALERQKDNTETDCQDESCASRVEKAEKFIGMVRESSLAPFNNINTEYDFTVKRNNTIPEKRRLPKKLFIAAGILVAACLTIITTFTFRNENVTGFHLNAVRGSVSFVSGDVSRNSVPAKKGDAANVGDSIITGSTSSAVINFDDKVIVAIGENSSVSLSELTVIDSKLHIVMDQSSGITFNRIKKDTAEYSIRSLTATAVVRGTAFSFICNTDNVSISLLHGSVLVSHTNGTGSQTMLEPGYTIALNENIISRPEKLSDEEIKNLEVLDSVADTAESPAKGISPEAEKILGGQSTVIPSHGKNRALSDIRKKYGALSIVEVTTGEKYIGFFKRSPDGIEIITEKGVISIQLSDLKSIAPYSF